MNNFSDNSLGSLGHRYTVELRFMGDVLEPSEITRLLNLQPSNAATSLEVNPLGRKRRAFWAYNGHREEGFQPEWESLEAGLLFLLRYIGPRRATVIALSKKFEGFWWCGHFQTSFDGGPTLSPKVLFEIASLGLPLSIDNYFSDKP